MLNVYLFGYDDATDTFKCRFEPEGELFPFYGTMPAATLPYIAPQVAAQNDDPYELLGSSFEMVKR